MGQLTLELVLWLLLAFFIGCILGCLFRKLLGNSGTQAATEMSAMPATAPDSNPEQQQKPVQAVATGVAKRPKGLAGPRNGKADQLQAISGIGPKMDKTLNSLGYFHYDQIANWTPDEVQWVDEHLRVKGRIERDQWIPQAKLLAGGDQTEFTRLYGISAGRSGSTSKPAPKSKPKTSPKPSVATGISKAPKKLKAAKGGKADDLQRISGVGPALEKTLHELGFFHFDQIAGWSPDEVQWVDERLRFKGRIEREEWIAQAKSLTAGD